MIELTPVAYVKNSRSEIKDDHWTEQSQIILADHIPAESLVGVEQYSHVHVLFYFHKANPARQVTGLRHPRNNRDWPQVGIFARRGKNRPNHLGLATVRVVSVEDRTLTVEGLDAIDGTPVVDIKPVMTGFQPKGEISEPDWSIEIMAQYWSPK